jgi:uncharacterized glyoxalase superfamily protein PhnB
MAQVIPMLSYEDVGSMIDWLGKAFGFKERERFEDEGRVTHAILDYEGGELHAGWPGPDYRSPKSHAETCETARKLLETPYVFDGVLLEVEDVDAHYARARGAGATIVRELEDAFFGRVYVAADPEGHRWMIEQAG